MKVIYADSPVTDLSFSLLLSSITLSRLLHFCSLHCFRVQKMCGGMREEMSKKAGFQ